MTGPPAKKGVPGQVSRGYGSGRPDTQAGKGLWTTRPSEASCDGPSAPEPISLLDIPARRELSTIKRMAARANSHQRRKLHAG